MKFLVTTIASHSEKSNRVTYQIIDTCTKLDGCFVQGFAPKSVELIQGLTQDVPYFVAKGIFGFNRVNNIKTLEKQLQAKAPAGQKRIWRAEASALFDRISALNIEQIEEPKGEYAGQPGEEITFMIKECTCVHSHNWTSQFGWCHTGHGWERPSGTKCLWKIVDMDDRVFMFSTSGDKTNSFLSEVTPGTIIQTKIDHLNDFHGLRQTWITRPQKAKGLLQLLA